MHGLVVGNAAAVRVRVGKAGTRNVAVWHFFLFSPLSIPSPFSPLFPPHDHPAA
jgi:hypothetical protein